MKMLLLEVEVVYSAMVMYSFQPGPQFSENRLPIHTLRNTGKIKEANDTCPYAFWSSN